MSVSPSRSKSQNVTPRPLPAGLAMPACFRDVGERPVAVVAIQPVRHPVEHRRMAVHAVAVLAQAAVRVVVDAGSRGSWRRRDRGRRRDRNRRSPCSCSTPTAGPATPAAAVTSAERAVAVVLVEEVGAEAGHVEIEIAVAVVVADGDAGLVGGLAGAAAVHARLRGHVLERAVLVVVVEHVCRARRAVDEIQVLEAVVVVVDPGDARAERLDHVLLGRGAGLVDERDSSLRRHVSKQRRAIGAAPLACPEPTGRPQGTRPTAEEGSREPSDARSLARAPASFFCFCSPPAAACACRRAAGNRASRRVPRTRGPARTGPAADRHRRGGGWSARVPDPSPALSETATAAASSCPCCSLRSPSSMIEVEFELPLLDERRRDARRSLAACASASCASALSSCLFRR